MAHNLFPKSVKYEGRKQHQSFRIEEVDNLKVKTNFYDEEFKYCDFIDNLNGNIANFELVFDIKENQTKIYSPTAIDIGIRKSNPIDLVMIDNENYTHDIILKNNISPVRFFARKPDTIIDFANMINETIYHTHALFNEIKGKYTKAIESEINYKQKQEVLRKQSISKIGDHFFLWAENYFNPRTDFCINKDELRELFSKTINAESFYNKLNKYCIYADINLVEIEDTFEFEYDLPF
jgi:hypothetical protein